MRWSPAPVGLLSIALLFGCSGRPEAAPSTGREDLAGRAETFARQFTDGEHGANLELMTEQMRNASGHEPSERLRSGLVAQHGEVSEVGDAWFEDKVQGYLRYRVPIAFERLKLDFRIVFDASDKIAGFFIVPHAPRVTSLFSGKEIELSVGPDDRALGATLTLPEGDGPFPGVVLVHGSGPNDRDETIGPNKPFRDLAHGLAERGVATLRYDKRSYARADDLVALGDTLTPDQEVVDDARAALRLLRTREEIDASAIFVAGHSLGGTLTPRIADMEPPPTGLISLAGMSTDLPEKMLEQYRYLASLDDDVSAEEKEQIEQVEIGVRALRAALEGRAPAPEGNMLGAPFAYHQYLDALDPPAETAMLGLPVLVLQGTRDYQVTLEDFARWEQALSGKPGACLVKYDGLDHLFRKGSGPSGPRDYERAARVETEVIDDLANWVRERRCPV